ncbi:MAG TPA: DEAD/DEAH box helicase family protein [Rhizomicrobium sp.]
MKIQFDANQTFQLDAIAAVTDLFEGQPQGAPEFAVIKSIVGGELFAGQERSELGLGNRLLVADDKLKANTRAVQARNDIEAADEAASLDAWEIFDAAANTPRVCPHFSVEMETGTGKTYVYLRTVFELSRRYGFKKFIVVVPSVAIREGVLKNIEITADHFRALYDNMPFEHFVYSARDLSKLRQFAVGNTLQILIINIDAFRKNFIGTEEERKSNVIYRENDKLSGRQPIEFVQAARPIVIIDEPQSVDSTEKSQEAIKSLNPLCTLRYSATHRNTYNLVYRLDPVRAFELRLVKQIVVGNARGDGATTDAYITVQDIVHKPTIRAKLRIHVQTADGVKAKTVNVKNGDDLSVRSEGVAAYAQGYSVTGISAEPEREFIRFSNGLELRKGQETGGMREDVWRKQIQKTIEKHLEKELQLHNRGIKVLSLFFIDRVANYRDYDEAGKPVNGKIARMFEEEFKALAKKKDYAVLDWLKEPLDKLHNGYFASDKKGVLKDTKGDSQADDDVYNLIMKEKERLLSPEEPLRFIFSHSALREGWDSPNVFQICTLNETQSAMKKRQEIGRGLRLPVASDGKRVFDDSINKLFVMANESYEEFARTLQKEYEEDCGVTFGKVPATAFAKLVQVVDGEEMPIGKVSAEVVRQALVAQKMLQADGRIGTAFEPRRLDFNLMLPAGFEDLTPAVVDLLSSYQIERHIRRERDERSNRLKKEVTLSPEFQELWKRIKPRTTYRVEFETDALVHLSIAELRRMARIEAPSVTVTVGRIEIKKAGVEGQAESVVREEIVPFTHGLPDILSYLQNETELTRSTLVRILKGSERLGEFFANPQRFMDQVASILKHVLHRLLVDGIKYDRIAGSGPEAEWEMLLFKDEEFINFLTAQEVKKSIYQFVPYDSEIEREFAKRLDQRSDIRLFVKLPDWFKVDTPVGTYNPDWAIVKHEDETVYLVRETKGTKDYLKLRTSEADKVRCGQKHFEALGVSFDVAVSANEI